jgi:23S rRNA (cytosine1962-C5)-methyltransferase
MPRPRVVLKPGREKPVLAGHPWVFSGAIARIDGLPADGDTIDVTDSRGEFLARGLLNRRSQIVVRLFTRNPDEDLTVELLQERIAAAQARRAGVLPRDTDAYRVVFSESDGLPGLIVDRYGELLSVQCSTLGLQRRKGEVVAALRAVFDPTAIVERPDAEALTREGLTIAASPLHGDLPPSVEITEYGLTFIVDLLGGQKTGFFLDQRENRRRVANYCGGARVLNCFAYTGAFGVYAAAAEAAQVINVDTSADALRLAERQMARNGFASERDEYRVGDVFQVLREYRERGEEFDLIILDPPKFAHNTEGVMRATRGYKDINLLALQLLRPNGVLATFSCSGLISADLFQKVIFGASEDAGRPAQIIERLTQAPDHPVLLSFPEGEYLKGLLCRAL